MELREVKAGLDEAPWVLEGRRTRPGQERKREGKWETEMK